MHSVELLVSALLVIFVLSPLIKMNIKLMMIYAAILVYSGFFGLVSPESLRIVGFINKANLAAIFIFGAFCVLMFDARALSVVRNKFQYSEYKMIFIYMWIFVAVSVLSYIMTIIDGYRVLDSFKLAFNFIQYSLLLPLYVLLLSLSEERFSWFISILEKMVFMNMVIYVLNNFGISLLAAENFTELNYGLVRNFQGFPELLPFFFCLAYLRFRKEISVWNSVFVFFAILTVMFTFTRSVIMALFFIVIFMEMFVIKNINIKAVAQSLISVLLLSISLVLFFPNEIEMLSERFAPAIGAASFDEVDNLSIRWIMVLERLDLLYEHPFFGVGFINPYDPNDYYNFSAGLGVITGDIFWPNLFMTTGLVGTLFFLLFQIEAFKLLFKSLDDQVVAATMGMLIFLLTISFASGIVFFNSAFSFLLVLGIALVAGRNRLIYHRDLT